MERATQQQDSNRDHRHSLNHNSHLDKNFSQFSVNGQGSGRILGQMQKQKDAYNVTKNEKTLAHQLATIKFSHCHRHKNILKSFSQICINIPCITCDNRGSRLYCAECHVKESNHEGLIELRSYLYGIYYDPQDVKNAKKSLDENSKSNTSNNALISNLQNSRAYLIKHQKQLGGKIQRNLQINLKKLLDMVETALTSLRVHYQTRNNKNFVRDLLKSETREDGVLNVENCIETQWKFMHQTGKQYLESERLFGDVQNPQQWGVEGVTNNEIISKTESSSFPTLILAKPILSIPEGLCPQSRNFKKDSKRIHHEEEFKSLPKLGQQELDDGSVQVGQWKDGWRHGWGEAQYVEDKIYCGYWKNDKCEGYGVAQQTDGDRYEGMFENCKRHGYGKLYLADGNRYEGMFENDSRHGQGVQQFANGERQEGMFKDDERHGWGKLYFADGGRYEGIFENGKRHGQGIQQCTGGARQKGHWRLNKRHGYGILYSANGDRYEGMFENGKRHGHGKLYFADGDRYEGLYENDKRHGQGIQQCTDGDRYEGMFENGKAHGQGVQQYARGARQDGNWRGGRKNGQGILYWSDGGRQEGEFENDQFNGLGTVHYSDGSRQKGHWRLNKRHGYGLEQTSEGEGQPQLWQNGVLLE